MIDFFEGDSQGRFEPVKHGEVEFPKRDQIMKRETFTKTKELLDTIDGRDKLSKMIQYGARLLKH